LILTAATTFAPKDVIPAKAGTRRLSQARNDALAAVPKACGGMDNSGSFKPLYRFRETFPNVRSQYFYFANLFKGAAIFMQVGCFYEFYSSGSPIPEMFSLKPLKPNNRGTKYGFPVVMGDDYAKRAVEKGMTVVFVMETGKYFDKIKCRLPRMKIRAA